MNADAISTDNINVICQAVERWSEHARDLEQRLNAELSLLKSPSLADRLAIKQQGPYIVEQVLRVDEFARKGEAIARQISQLLEHAPVSPVQKIQLVVSLSILESYIGLLSSTSSLLQSRVNGSV